jgi:hypothetical protein
LTTPEQVGIAPRPSPSTEKQAHLLESTIGKARAVRAAKAEHALSNEDAEGLQYTQMAFCVGAVAAPLADWSGLMGGARMGTGSASGQLPSPNLERRLRGFILSARHFVPSAPILPKMSSKIQDGSRSCTHKLIVGSAAFDVRLSSKSGTIANIARSEKCHFRTSPALPC